MTSTWLNYALWSYSPNPFLSAGQPFINLRDRIVLPSLTHSIPVSLCLQGNSTEDALCRGEETLCVMLWSVGKSIYTILSSKAGLRFFCVTLVTQWSTSAVLINVKKYNHSHSKKSRKKNVQSRRVWYSAALNAAKNGIHHQEEIV